MADQKVDITIAVHAMLCGIVALLSARDVRAVLNDPNPSMLSLVAIGAEAGIAIELFKQTFVNPPQPH